MPELRLDTDTSGGVTTTAPAPDVPLETLRRLAELQERRKKAAPLLFRRTWRCDRVSCDGTPHDGAAFKHARSDQVIPWDQPIEILDESGTLVERILARIFYLVGGRGSGKTWAGGRNFAQLVLETEPDDGDDHTEWGVVGPTYRDTRDTLIEGPSGLIRALGYERDGGYVAKWDRSYGHLRLTTGALIYADSANDGGQRIQGKNLYGAWCDEIGLWKSWRRAWSESLLFAVRKGPARIICTGTPKRSSLAKEVLSDPTVGRRRLRTVDNLANLAKDAVDWLMRRYAGTTLGKQELEGELVDDVEGALWKRDTIDTNRVADPDTLGPHRPRFWRGVVVSLDPSDGLEDGDEQGLAEIGLSAEDHELYVLNSDGLRLTPWDFLAHAVDRCLSYAPDVATLVLEKNHGGQYLVGLLEQVLKAKGVRVPYHVVDAGGTSKRTRAEQVSGLYEQHKVHHVGYFADLEDQMCTWTGLGHEPSPDRMDALVWALTYFLGHQLSAPLDVSDAVVRWGDVDPQAAAGVAKWR